MWEKPKRRLWHNDNYDPSKWNGDDEAWDKISDLPTTPSEAAEEAGPAVALRTANSWTPPVTKNLLSYAEQLAAAKTAKVAARAGGRGEKRRAWSAKY